MSVSFVVITAAYISIFYSLVWTGATARDEDVRVAKKMALLIGTDFLCWAPTIFFGMLMIRCVVEFVSVNTITKSVYALLIGCFAIVVLFTLYNE